MLEYMEQLPLSEADNLKRTIKDIFRQTCILQVKYDPATLVPRDNPRYKTLENHREFIRDYLEVIGCELNYDPQEHIFWITGAGVAAEKLSETTTLLVLLLKLIYRDKIMGAGLNPTVTNLTEIREYGKNTNLINRKLTMGEWKEALGLMKTHQMIELPGAIGNVDDNTPIYIYGTINIYCSATNMNELIKRYTEEAKELAVSIDEDETDETDEENIYENTAE